MDTPAPPLLLVHRSSDPGPGGDRSGCTAAVHQQPAASAVTTRAELIAEGGGRGRLDHRVRAGRHLRVAPSVYLSPGAPLLDQVRAAVAHTGPASAVTGWAGCALHDLRYVPAGSAVPVLVSPKRGLVSTPFVQVLRTTRTPPARLREPGLRVAAVERCLVDAARASRDLREVRALVLHAVATGRATESALRSELDAGARGGSGLCRRALDDARRGAASAPEAEAADAVLAAGLRGVLLNPGVTAGGRLLGRPDGWLRGLGLGWEVDSREHHEQDDLFEATLARHDAFAAEGLLLLHVTPARLRRGGWAEQVVRAARARRREGYREPAGLVVTPAGPLLPVSPAALRRWAPA